MPRVGPLAIACAGMIFLASCGGGSNSSSPQGNGPLSANWQYTLTPPSDGSFSGGIQGGFLLQNGASVKGQAVYSIWPAGQSQNNNQPPCNSGSANVTGTANGQSVSLTAIAGNQTYTLTGNLSADGTTMSGTYSSTAGSNGCGTAQSGLQWTANIVQPLNGTVQGVFHSTGSGSLLNQDFAVTGSLTQGSNIGASSATVTGTLNFDTYPCMGTAYLNGQISGNSVILQMFDGTGNNVGTIGARTGQTNPSPVTFRAVQGGAIVQGLNGYGVSNKQCPGGNVPGDTGNVCLALGSSTACTQPILLSPPLLNFPQQQLGSTPTSQAITLTNNDPSGSTLSGLTIAALTTPSSQLFGTPSDFSETPNFTEQDTCTNSPAAPFSLKPQQSCTITITFDPQQSCPWLPYNNGVAQEGLASVLCPFQMATSLVVTDPQNANNNNDNNAQFAIPITGIGLSSIIPATGELDFGSEALGESSATQKLTFTNQGPQSVQILPEMSNPPCGAIGQQQQVPLPRPLGPGIASGLQMVLGGANAQPIANPGTVRYVCDLDTSSNKPNFQISADTCSGLVLAPQATCTIDVTFVPQPAAPLASGLDEFLELNTLQCTSSVTSDCEIDSGRFPVEIKANTPSPLRMTPGAAVEFGLQQLGTTSFPFTINLYNDPKDPNSQTITFGGNQTRGNFLETDDCGASLAPGSSCTLTFTYTPKNLGLEQGTFVISYPVGQTQTIYLRGSGCSLNPDLTCTIIPE